jgi:hypothetical protein
MTEPEQATASEGGCLCGAMRYRVVGKPRRTTSCHCLHCRRASGAPFVTWMEFPSSDFTWLSGTPARYESRPQVTRGFCRNCGSQLTYEHAAEPGTIDLTACSLDNVDAVSPEDHVWCDRMVPWVKLSDGLPRYGLGRSDA